MKTALVVMAAGIGSRFGGGIKQLTRMGPGGEIIIDYSVYDALEAGFDKIVFVIRKDLLKDFKEIIGDRLEKHADIAYAFQELEDIPAPFKVPAGRTKPWGTGQAILAARDVVDEPFAVINADDYYGKEGFVRLHEFLTTGGAPKAGEEKMGMAGFILGNTLSDNGSVKRGICRQDENGFLVDIKETFDLVRTDGGAGIEQKDGTVVPVDPESLASMNMWAFYPTIFGTLEDEFRTFLENVPEGDLKAEFLLPDVVERLIKSGRGSVKVLPSHDRWCGVTYKEDTPGVEAAFRDFVEKGIYRSPLF